MRNKLKIILNHKLNRRYKHILRLETVKRTKKGLSVSRAKEKNLINDKFRKDIKDRSESIQNNLNNFDNDMQKEKDNSIYTIRWNILKGRILFFLLVCPILNYIFV